MISFRIEKRLPPSGAGRSRGRAGVIETPHGNIETPAFIPVGTKATVKALPPELVRDQVGAQAVLSNTYHLYLQPGHEIVRKAGGLGKFMNWGGPTFTDSGGFQAFSLRGGMKFDEDPRESVPKLAKVDDDGVDFKSVIDGSSHRFTPESSIDIQHALGADIIFTLDEISVDSLARTHTWAKRCLDRHTELGGDQALFGIVQGGKSEDLRRESARTIGAMDFEGFGIGGTFEKADMPAAVRWACEELPEDKPRHLLGIGEPEDIILGIENGADTFDCVAPTRLGRNGAVYTATGRLNLLNARFVEDFTPLDPDCGCHTCRNYSRAYLAHLFRAKEMLAATLASIHNLYFLVALTKDARKAIIDGRFEEFKQNKLGQGK